MIVVLDNSGRHCNRLVLFAHARNSLRVGAVVLPLNG